MASEPKWTTGPWWAEGSNVFAQLRCIALCDTDNDTVDRYEANAHLIAAAPDLYAALERARRYLTDVAGALLSENSPNAKAWFGDIDAALAKARGTPALILATLRALSERESKS